MDYDELLGFYTHRGFRVIACATKHVKNLNKAEVQAMNRSDAESGLEFIGFIIFENKLKPASAAIINELNEAGIRKVMCTGDNILTAISVARECQLIDRTAHCFVPQFYEGIIYTLIIILIRLMLSYLTSVKMIREIIEHALNGKVWIIRSLSSTNIHFLYPSRR